MEIHFKRTKQRFLAGPTMTIFLNENKYSLNNGEEITVEVPKGINTVVIRCSIRGKRLKFAAYKDVVIELNWSRMWGYIEAYALGPDIEMI